MDTSIFEFIKGLLFLLPELAVLSACIYYLAKAKTVDAVLLTIGSFMGVCVMIFFRILFPLMQYTFGSGSMGGIIINVVSFIGLAGSIMFATGLFLLIIKMVKARTITNS